MFSNDLKNEIIKKFHLAESIINSSKHYKIPNFVFKAKSMKPRNKIYNYNPNFYSKITSLRNFINHKSIELKNLSKTQYYERKRENMNKLLSKLQREKIDLLIDRAYHNINDKIREDNTSISLPRREKKIKLDFLPLVQKKIIIESVMNKAEKYLPLINKKYDFMKYGYKQKKQKEFDEERKIRQKNWSENILMQKNIEDYEKIYKIKYLNTDQSSEKDKFKDELIQKDFDSPKRNKRYKTISKNRTHNSMKNSSTVNISQTTNSENKSANVSKNNKNK